MSPMRPRKICTHPGCGAVVDGGRCEWHKPAPRPSPARRGYDRHWVKLRKWFLQRNGACAHCGSLASDVHHKIPLTERPDLRLVTSNLLPLCHSCHSAVTSSGHNVTPPIRGRGGG